MKKLKLNEKYIVSLKDGFVDEALVMGQTDSGLIVIGSDGGNYWVNYDEIESVKSPYSLLVRMFRWLKG